MSKDVPIHQWTNEDGEVLIVKQVGAGRKTYGGFQWPDSGEVTCPDWSPEPECGHGLHGWPWGLSLGDGVNIDYSAEWLVFAAKPDAIIDLGGKVKCRSARIVMYGDWNECLGMVTPGLSGWCSKHANGNASNTGYGSAASNTGDWSAASNTGDRSAASNTGDRSDASNTGYGSAASNTGYGSAASNTGDRSAASNTGHGSAASNTGHGSAASNTGDGSAASNTGDWSAASNTGDRSAASNTGDRSDASNTGYGSAASNTGYGSAASNTGDRSAASNTGHGSAASNTGDWSAALVTESESSIELGPKCVGCSTAQKFTWIVRIGAVLLIAWEKPGGDMGHRTLDSEDMDVSDGDRLRIEDGEIVATTKATTPDTETE